MANSKTGSGTKPWEEKYQDNQATINADANRKSVEAQKPGKFTFGAYQKGTAARQADTNLQQHKANAPGAFQYSMQNQFDDTWNKIMNREKFTYDINGDALYQQYKDQYTRQGQMAMEDTMGQAAALTGGYGNSYSQQVGQQTYNSYMQQLNDKIPELYQLALDQYNREGQDLYNQYSMHSDRYAQEYGQHRDKVSDYNTDRAYLTDEARYQNEQDYDKYMDSYNMAYGQHRDAVGDWQNDMNLADAQYWNEKNFGYGQYSDNRGLSYQQHRDSVADDQWKRTFQHQVERDQEADRQWQATFDEGVRQFDTEQSNWQKNFDEGIRQFNKESTISAIASAGYTPTDEELEAAGMTREQADAMRPVKETKSIDAGSEAETAIMSAIDGAESVGDLASVVKKYVDMGYSEAEIVAMTEDKAKELEKKPNRPPLKYEDAVLSVFKK